ncbi:hypothetical protein DV735_g20, partial [Chaetothyriales sp. CBS 134920]
MASDASPPASSFPASLGPGARPPQAGQASPGTTLREVMDIRRAYQITVDPTSLHLGYQLDGQTRRYSIPFENMPIGAITKRMCFGGVRGAQVTGIFIIDAIRGAENMTGQQLSQTEAEGFAKHSVKRIQYAVMGNLVAVVGAYAVAYRGIKDMKFPFMKPKDAERYTNFPNRFYPILRGSGARLMWQMTRFNVYALIGLFAAGPVFASMGDVSMMAGLYQDHRTRSVLTKMKEQGGFNRISSNRSRPGQPKAQPQSQISGDDLSPQDTQQDQGSGYGGAESYPSGDSSFSDASADDQGTLQQATAWGQAPEARSTQRQERQQAQRPNSSPTPTSSSSSDFFFDDASPVADNDAAGANRSRTGGSSDGSGESVWSRIRRGNTAAATTTASSAPSPDSSFSNQSSYSSQPLDEDQQQQWQRQKAQREFDAMLEQERKQSGREDYWQGAPNRSADGAGEGERP